MSDEFDHDNPDWLIKPRDRRADRSKVPKDYRPPDPPEVNRSDTRHWWEFISRDDWWQSQMPISLQAMSSVLKMSKGQFSEQIRNAGKESDWALLPKIGRLIPIIERRALVFPGVKRGGGPKEHHTPKFLWLDPPETPPRIPRLADENAWSLWAVCSSCGKNKFIPTTAGVVCYHCNHPDKHRYGGKWVKEKSLIHAALKKFY